jgi:hypothetical protein
MATGQAGPENKKGRGETAPTFSCHISRQCQYIRGQKHNVAAGIASAPNSLRRSPAMPMDVYVVGQCVQNKSAAQK